MMQNQSMSSGHTGPLSIRPAPAAAFSSTLFRTERAAKGAGPQRRENLIDLSSAAPPRSLPSARRATFILIGGLCVCVVLIVSAAAVATAYFL